MSQTFTEELARVPMAPNLVATLTRAADYARDQGHGKVTLEHMLLALTQDADAPLVLQASGVSVDRLTSDAATHLSSIEPSELNGTGDRLSLGPDLKRVLEAAAAAAQQGRRQVSGAIVLAAIVGEGKSTAAQILRAHGLTFEHAIKALQQQARAQQARAGQQPAQGAKRPEPARPAAAPPPPPAAPAAPAPHAAPQPPAAAAAPKPAASPPLPPPPPVPAPPTTATTAVAAAAPASRPAPAAPPTEPAKATPPPPPQTPPPVPRQRPSPPQVPQPAQTPPPAAPVAAPPPPPPPPPAPPPEPAPAPPRAFEPDWAPAGLGQADGYAPQPPPEPRTMPGRPAPQPSRLDDLPSWPPPPHLAPAPPPQAPQPPPYEPQFRGPDLGSAPPQAFGAPPRHEPEPAYSPEPHHRTGRELVPQYAPPGPDTAGGQLIENIPRKMRNGVPVIVEVRLVPNADAPPPGYGGPLPMRAMTVRLTDPDGSFQITPLAVETQWIDGLTPPSGQPMARWRWSVTPQQGGREQLQLTVSARWIGPQGISDDIPLPVQTVTVSVRRAWLRGIGRLLGWLLVAVIGGAIALLGAPVWPLIMKALKPVIGG